MKDGMTHGQGNRGKPPRRGISSRPGERRLNGLEAVYLTKFQKPQYNNFREQKGKVPCFRPTLNKFEDNPEVLNVDTEMNGTKSKDISLKIADKLDQLQKHYLSQTEASLQHHQSQYMSHAKNLHQSYTTTNQAQNMSLPINGFMMDQSELNINQINSNDHQQMAPPEIFQQYL